MNKQDFSTAKVGDRLWSKQLGVCEVKEIDLMGGVLKMQSITEGIYFWFYCYNYDDKFPSLFWSNPNIQIPERPKMKVKKEKEIVINIYEDGTESFHHTKLSADNYSNGLYKEQLKGIITYEVEE